MSKSIKYKNNTYLDSSSITHNKEILSKHLNNINSSCFCILNNGNLKEERQATFETTEITGDAFTIENNNIKIQNAKRIRISANISLQFQQSGQSFIMIKIVKNNDIILRNYAFSNNMALYFYDSCNISSFELDVNKNDIIKMYISSELNGMIHNDEWGKSYISVEKIK